MLSNFVRIGSSLFSLSAALICLSLSIVAYAASPADPKNAQSYMVSGLEHFHDGRFSDALREWSRAERLSAAANDPTGQGRALFRKGSAYTALGKYRDALINLQQALVLKKETADPRLVARITGSLAYVYAQLGRTKEGMQLLQRSIVLAKESRDMKTAVAGLNNLGNLYASNEQYEKAGNAYRKSLEIAGNNGLDSLAAKAAVNLARSLLAAGESERARSALDEAMLRVEKLTPSHAKAYALISLGRLYGRLEGQTSGNRLIAAQAFESAQATAELIADQRALSFALGYLGRLYEEDDRYYEALQLTHRADKAAQQVGATEGLYQWQWQTGRLLREQGEIEPAVAAYRRAVYTLQSLRKDLSRESFSSQGSFRKTFGPLFLEYADLLLEHSEAITDAAQVEFYLREVRETVEQMKGAELEDYFQDDCVAALKEKTKGIDRLAVRTAAIYPIIFKDRLELLLSLPVGIQRFSSPVAADTLVEEVRALRLKLEKRTTHQYLTHAKRVYDWLIRPLQPTLRKNGIDTLIIVPDGALRTIPMAALHDGEQFLIHHYAIATTPGLTLTDPRPLPQEKMQVLLGGLSESVQGFPPLPNVNEELENIQQLYEGKIIKNREFNIQNMESELTRIPYSIVHVASHGQFDKDVNNTFLLTYDGKLSMDALEAYLGISKFRKDPVELLTLSACQTAAGDDRAALGLAGIAIKAGARSALATLWFISDQASSLLVSEFYQRLQDSSLSKAMALQQAQLSLIKDRRYRHPGYWSPFLLIGNWL